MTSSLTAVITAGSTAVALADEPRMAPGEAYTEVAVRPQGSRMEHDELTEPIKNYYAPIKSAYSMIDTTGGDQGSITMTMCVMAGDYISQADQLADVLSSGSPAITQVMGEPGCYVPAQTPWTAPLNTVNSAGAWTAR